jgi:hypothetical protein
MSDWRKSTFSGANECVEVRFDKSSHSVANGCVEVAINSADPTDDVWVRDSKDKGEGPILKFTATEWEAFLAGVRGDEFDLPGG